MSSVVPLPDDAPAYRRDRFPFSARVPAAAIRRLRGLLIALSVMILPVAQAGAQTAAGPPIPPINFATTHFWGSPQAISTQFLALGSAYAAEGGSFSIGQPASITAVQKREALYQYGKSDFSTLPTFVSSYSAFITPLGRGNATVMEVAIATVDGRGQITGGATPLTLHTNETDVGIVIGHRFSRRLQVGLGTGYLGTTSQYAAPGNVQIETIHSAPKPTLGGRLGIVYHVTPRLSLGATYDNYTEQVTSDVTGVPASSNSDFHSVGYRVGLAWHPDPRTMLLLDREEIGLHGGGTSISRRSTLMGAERRIGSAAIRLGLFQNHLTGGLGVSYHGFNLSYAFTNRYGASLPGTGAKTSNNIQLTAAF